MARKFGKADWIRLGGASALAGALAAALTGCGSTDSGDRPDARKDLLDLRISEIHYHPSDQDTVSGDDYEFVEIRNTGSATLDLEGVGFSTGIEYEFPKGTTLGAGKYLVLASVPARFEERYGFEPAGTFTGKLNNAGETVTLEDLRAQSVIDSVTYADDGAWPVSADGGGYSLVPTSSSAGAPASAWRASFRLNGSPGRGDQGAAVINEVLTHTDPPATDAIEIYNPEDAALDLGGWYLSDDEDVPAKFRIPAGTSIPAKGHLVFYEKDFNKDSSSSSFNLSAHGEDIWLSADSTGCRNYCHTVSFGEVENGLTFGRLVTSDGRELFPIQKQTSLGSANAGPMVGPVVLSEIMYHSVNDSDDYLEVTNSTNQPVDLFDKNRPANTWKIEGIAFTFPAGITLAAGEAVLVVPARSDTARIRSVYTLPGSVRIFKAAGELSNAADTLTLMKPEDPYLKDGAAEGDSTVPFQRIDRVGYQDGGAWPSEADGDGRALQRKSLSVFGDDPANWTAGVPAPAR